MEKKEKKQISQALANFATFIALQPKGFAYREKKVKPTPASCSSHISRDQQLKQLFCQYTACMSCPLATQGRKQVVFGNGNAHAQLMFIGEGPGRDEDEQGAPFVGRAGQLLTKIIEAMGLRREDVYISNVVKCRPPENRAPLPNESTTCKNLLLYNEIDIVNPRIICTLGATATQALLGDDIKITKVRGIFVEFRGIALIPTYHPAYLLRNPAEKKTVWEDMKKIMEKLKA